MKKYYISLMFLLFGIGTGKAKIIPFGPDDNYIFNAVDIYIAMDKFKQKFDYYPQEFKKLDFSIKCRKNNNTQESRPNKTTGLEWNPEECLYIYKIHFADKSKYRVDILDKNRKLVTCFNSKLPFDYWSKKMRFGKPEPVSSISDCRFT